MNRRGKTVLVLAAALALAGCWDKQPNRPLTFEPGAYKGQKSPSLTEEQLRSLRDRMRYMADDR